MMFHKEKMWMAAASQTTRPAAFHHKVITNFLLSLKRLFLNRTKI